MNNLPNFMITHTVDNDEVDRWWAPTFDDAKLLLMQVLRSGGHQDEVHRTAFAIESDMECSNPIVSFDDQAYWIRPCDLVRQAVAVAVDMVGEQVSENLIDEVIGSLS